MKPITTRSNRTLTPDDVADLIDEISRFAAELHETASSASTCLRAVAIASQAEGPTHPMLGEIGKTFELNAYLLDSIHFHHEILRLTRTIGHRASKFEKNWTATGIRVSIDVAGEQRVSR